MTISNGTDPITLSKLIPELTGFEMVVASTNNTAVENISRDLPKRSSIVAPEEFDYLQPVAHKVAAQKRNGDCIKLADDDIPWGLISCALGRKSNRWAFSSRCFKNKISADAKKTWAGTDKPLTIWQWRELSPKKAISFADASRIFAVAEAKVEDFISKLSHFAVLSQKLRGSTRDSWCFDTKRAQNAAQSKLKISETILDRNKAELADARFNLRGLQEEERLLDRAAPPWWQRLLGLAAAREYPQRVRTNAEAQIQQASRVHNLGQNLSSVTGPAHLSAKLAAKKAQSRLQKVQEEWIVLEAELHKLRDRYGKIDSPENLCDLENDTAQKAGLWHLRELAQLRSDLFQAALQLHEAWLAEVSCKGGGFGGNLMAVGEMLQGNIKGNTSVQLAIWQSLFMMVPVVSTTFASCARQFHGLGRSAFGWVFIDEAGQAVPQAAVGMLYRAQRALVIGDPLQIEPVFTLSKRLIGDLAAQSPTTSSGSYSPDVVSVQTLADLANPFGTEVSSEGEGGIWVGSPLRVHRRCVDPMFSVANAIAYHDKMVFGLDQRSPAGDDKPFFGDSAWIDIPGQVNGRQSVPKQVEFVARLLIATYARFERLPDVYVISPFKEVKENLVQRMNNKSELWNELCAQRPPNRALKKWLDTRVGTVHTFQGKEEDTVIMVLGADCRTLGAIGWAASKPNLLNVALTRAKRRFYMVGDRRLWAGHPFFSTAAQSLPSLTMQTFRKRTHDAWSGRADEYT